MAKEKQIDPGYNPFEDEAVNPAGKTPPPKTVEPSSPETVAPAPVNSPTEKPKRKRRTKAEMAAARAAEAAAKAAAEPQVPEDPELPDDPLAVVENLNILRKLFAIQQEIGAIEKDSVSDLDRDETYRYRSLEGIESVLKPACFKHGCLFRFVDDVVVKAGDYRYVKATVQLVDVETGEALSASGWAREDDELAGKWASQVTGSCSTYARKYALSALFVFTGGTQDDPDAFPAPPTAPDASSRSARRTLVPGVGDWNRAVAEASKWNGTADELKAAVREKFIITDDDLNLLLAKAGLL